MKCVCQCADQIGGHGGKVQAVRVTSRFSSHVFFGYCEKAIAEDKRNGYAVVVLWDESDEQLFDVLSSAEKELIEELAASIIACGVQDSGVVNALKEQNHAAGRYLEVQIKSLSI